MFLTPAVAEHYKPQNTHQKESGKKNDPRPTPKLVTSANAAALNSPFCARAATCAPKHQKPTTTKTHVHSGIRTRNRQYAYILVPRPLPPPSMLVLAGRNRKWALSVVFVHGRFPPPNNYFRLSPFCSFLPCGSVPVGRSGSIGEFSSRRSGPGASGRRFRSPGRGCARKPTGRHVWPCFGSQLHTTEGGQPKIIIFGAVLHILDARGHNSTKAT